jgi:hypothetical protein
MLEILAMIDVNEIKFGVMLFDHYPGLRRYEIKQILRAS